MEGEQKKQKEIIPSGSIASRGDVSLARPNAVLSLTATYSGSYLFDFKLSRVPLVLS